MQEKRVFFLKTGAFSLRRREKIMSSNKFPPLPPLLPLSQIRATSLPPLLSPFNFPFSIFHGFADRMRLCRIKNFQLSTRSDRPQERIFNSLHSPPSPFAHLTRSVKHLKKHSWFIEPARNSLKYRPFNHCEIFY